MDARAPKPIWPLLLGLALLLAVLLAVAQLQRRGPAGSAVVAAITPAAGPVVELSLRQRSASALPGWDARLQLHLDDITGGAVLAWLSYDGRALAGPQRLRPGAALAFEAGGQPFAITLLRLDNALVGQDYAAFRIAPRAAATPDADEVEAALAHLARLPAGTVFIRNGQDYPATEAVAHLRGKWQAAGATGGLEAFIECCASRSQASGEPYRLRLVDGSETELASYLRSLPR